MREYGKVFPRFWQAGTGKALRGDAESQVLALYLMTSPHATMIGVFHCPIQYMAHETGLTLEGASKALARLIEADFCTFDGDDDVVWVHEMAAHQVGTMLHHKDKQVIGITKQYAQIAQRHIRRGFYDRYKDDFHLPEWVENTRTLEGAYKALRCQEQEQEQEQEQDNPPPNESADSPGQSCKKPVNGTPIAFATFLARCKESGERPIADYRPVWVYAEKVGIPEDSIVLCWQEFSRKYGDGGGRSSKRYKDWRQTFRNCVEENWLGLWTLDEQGRATLTSKGRIAEKVTA
jgi:hypothetical protein